MQKQTVTVDFDGNNYSIETGLMAKQANGSVMVSCGDTMVLVTVVASEQEKPDIDFLPLQVEYREKTASAGKIPGGFLKREGRPSDHEVLCSRLIDRPIRPMLPKTWRYETQIIATCYSSDPEFLSDTLAAVGASAALLISDIPFNGPVSEVRVARLDGEFIINPSYELLKKCDIDITVAGTDDSIAMVEGECHEISEDEFLEALDFAHSKIRILNDLQRQLLVLTSKPKREFTEKVIPDEITVSIKDILNDDILTFVHAISTKEERHEQIKNLQERALEHIKANYSEKEEYAEAPFESWVAEIVNKSIKEKMRKMIVEEGRRLDGRKLDQIRPISIEIGILPRAHGSALFTRGETQSLTTVTLGTKHDEQLIDGLQPTYTNRFLLHYNFPPFCTGEVGKIGSVGRREIGHGHLAERALKIMSPTQEDFPYTIRIVSDILESNGSSSMATVCAGSLAMFDAGIPMIKSVAGIAMGLIKEENDVAILSDILGDEDFLGDMDFKVTGTVDGITACQMDIKIQGLSIDIMKKALEQAKAGRMHILNLMDEAINQPRTEVSQFAPRYHAIYIPHDTIGAVIGPGGETIRSIVSDSGAEINIEDDGKVMIAAVTKESADIAIKRIEAIIRKPEEGAIYKGVIKEVRDELGAFVEFMPGKQGLLHISQISHARIERASDVLKAGDEIEVKLLEVSRDGKFRLSSKALTPRPDDMPPNDDDRYNRNSNNRSNSGYGDRNSRGPSGNRERSGNRDSGSRDRRR